MGSLFAPKMPAPPEPPPPTPMADEELIAKRKKEALMKSRSRGGRSSTILSDGETLG